VFWLAVENAKPRRCYEGGRKSKHRAQASYNSKYVSELVIRNEISVSHRTIDKWSKSRDEIGLRRRRERKCQAYVMANRSAIEKKSQPIRVMFIATILQVLSDR
jgi:hypothetical protein